MQLDPFQEFFDKFPFDATFYGLGAGAAWVRMLILYEITN